MSMETVGLGRSILLLYFFILSLDRMQNSTCTKWVSKTVDKVIELVISSVNGRSKRIRVWSSEIFFHSTMCSDFVEQSSRSPGMQGSWWQRPRVLEHISLDAQSVESDICRGGLRAMVFSLLVRIFKSAWTMSIAPCVMWFATRFEV